MRAAGLGVLCAVFVVGAVAIGGTMSGTKKLRADATVTQIDRTCSFVIKATKEVIEDDCNSTGEFASFTVAERKAIMEVVGKAKGNLNVLCTSGTANVADTIELSQHAADHGADGVIVLPPYYVKGPSTEGLLRYYTMVMDAMPKSLSFYLYHVPRWSTVVGMPLPPPTRPAR